MPVSPLPPHRVQGAAYRRVVLVIGFVLVMSGFFAAILVNDRSAGMVGILGLLGIDALFAWLAFRVSKDFMRTLTCARDGDVVEVDIQVGVPLGRGAVRYEYRVVGEPSTLHKTVLQARAPRLVADGQTRALALRSRSQPNVIILMGDNGYPFVM